MHANRAAGLNELVDTMVVRSITDALEEVGDASVTSEVC